MQTDQCPVRRTELEEASVALMRRPELSKGALMALRCTVGRESAFIRTADAVILESIQKVA